MWSGAKRQLCGRAVGFTIVELLLILVVLVVLAAAVFTSVSDYNIIKLNSTARKLVSDIRFAQQLAMTRQVRHGVIFTTATPYSYTVFENDNTADPARDPMGGGDFTVNYSTGEFQGVMISTTLPNSIVKFDSRGAPLRFDNTTLAAPNNTVTLSLSGVTPVTLVIEPNTGRVSY